MGLDITGGVDQERLEKLGVEEGTKGVVSPGRSVSQETRKGVVPLRVRRNLEHLNDEGDGPLRRKIR